MRRLTTFLCAALALPAAAAAHPHHGAFQGSYQVVALGGGQQKPAVRQTITFSREGTVSGNGGCNSFRGSYQIQGQAIIVGDVLMTRRACGEAVMQTEQRFMRALQSIRLVQETGNGGLRFSAKGGAHILTLAPISRAD
ncbi:MAG: META domain-containing protein [Pseudomonadota bacterium]